MWLEMGEKWFKCEKKIYFKSNKLFGFCFNNNNKSDNKIANPYIVYGPISGVFCLQLAIHKYPTWPKFRFEITEAK